VGVKWNRVVGGMGRRIG